MVPCPACGSKTIVRDTVPYEGAQYRRRRCVNCGKSVYTVKEERRIDYWPSEVMALKNGNLTPH